MGSYLQYHFCNFKIGINQKSREVIKNVKVLIETGEDGYFVVSVPSLKGCWSQGKTREQALNNIREAIELYLETDEVNLVNERREMVELAI